MVKIGRSVERLTLSDTVVKRSGSLACSASLSAYAKDASTSFAVVSSPKLLLLTSAVKERQHCDSISARFSIVSSGVGVRGRGRGRMA